MNVDNQTSILTLSVEAKNAVLAAEVANCLIGYLNDFNATVRQSQAREKRKFAEERVLDGERELREAEDSLGDFYDQNRSWQTAPQLVFREGRLRRQVEVFDRSCT